MLSSQQFFADYNRSQLQKRTSLVNELLDQVDLFLKGLKDYEQSRLYKDAEIPITHEPYYKICSVLESIQDTSELVLVAKDFYQALASYGWKIYACNLGSNYEKSDCPLVGDVLLSVASQIRSNPQPGYLKLVKC